MAKAIELVVDKEFVSKHDNDEIKTTWIIRTLTGIEFMRCTASGYVDYEMTIMLGLVGWKDFNNEDGSPIEFSKENIGRIPPLILQDISFQIQSLSSMGDDERKNS